MIVAQLTDTHIVSEGGTYFGVDTAAALRSVIDALHALPQRPACAIVTGDLVNSGSPAQYARFVEVMSALRVPYFVVPGNHDEREALRATLAPLTYGRSRDGAVRYVIERFEVRLVGLDANGSGRWPGARLDRATLAWLRETLSAQPGRPTLVCIHQPPFRTGLHYLDVFGFGGARRLRALVERQGNSARVISGHIHCARSARWGAALALTAPSTAPQAIPLLFMDGKVLGLRRETPGFALHEWSPATGFTSTIYRRTGGDGSFHPSEINGKPLTR